jgi:hypothetical protein
LSALLVKVVANVFRALAILNGHLVAALTAIDYALQERRALAGNSSALFVIILSVIVAEHGLDLNKAIPTDECRIVVFYQDFPLVHF